MRAPDICIVGAGVVGCAVAYELARRGIRVRVFEARTPGAGATQASAGILAPFVEAHHPGPLLDLTVRGLSRFDDFVSRVVRDGESPVEYRRAGTLQVATTADAADALRAVMQQHRAAGLEWLDGLAIRELEPAMTTAVVGGVLAREHRYVAVSPFVAATVAAAIRHGATFESGRPVVGISAAHQGGTVRIEFKDGATVVCGRVVVAAGSWMSMLGLSDRASQAVRPVRGQLLRLGWPAAELSHVLWGEECYMVPWEDGTVLVGATVEEVGFDERTTVAGVRDLLDAAGTLVPAVRSAAFLEARAGLRPGTSDGLPIVGPAPGAPGIVYAAGHYRNGILLAPLTAELVADYLVDDRRDPILDVLSPGRF